MEIHFTKKEEETHRLNVRQFDYLYLIAIKNSNPLLWNDFRNMVMSIDAQEQEETK